MSAPPRAARFSEKRDFPDVVRFFVHAALRCSFDTIFHGDITSESSLTHEAQVHNQPRGRTCVHCLLAERFYMEVIILGINSLYTVFIGGVERVLSVFISGSSLAPR